MIFSPKHFLWSELEGVATITLNRPDRKNPLTFESYAELRDTFLKLRKVSTVKVVIIRGAGENFCSGGDVHEIIGPLTKLDSAGLLKFTQMTGDLIKAMMHCPQIVIACVDGICAGAGAAIAMASDLRYGTERSKVAFLFVRVGLAGCDMGACAVLPRIIGHGRAAELLYSGRAMPGSESLSSGFYSALFAPNELENKVMEIAKGIAKGPTLAHAMTKKMLHHEWALDIDRAIDVEAQTQAECMKTNDFKRAFLAFSNKEKPNFEGN